MDYIARAKKFRAKKNLGQNFLIDENAINLIIENADIQPDDIVLEIGAGLGFVTEQAARLAKKVYAVEIDKAAIEELKKLPFDNIEIIENDILKTDISKYAAQQKLKIIANIPYYITSPILAHLLGEIDDENNKNRNSISQIILMVQYEVARRICATPKNKNKEYGSLSILCNFYSDTEYIKKIGARSFFPAPKVNSALVKLVVRENPLVEISDYTHLRKVIKSAFSQRRKNLKNCLLSGGFSKDNIQKTLSKLGWDENIRGEKLSISDFANLSEELLNGNS